MKKTSSNSGEFIVVGNEHGPGCLKQGLESISNSIFGFNHVNSYKFFLCYILELVPLTPFFQEKQKLWLSFKR